MVGAAESLIHNNKSRQLDWLARHFVSAVPHSLMFELRTARSRLLIVEPKQLRWIVKPSPQNKKLNPSDLTGWIFGWGSWIRTNTSGVRVRCSTIKLCPKACFIIYLLLFFSIKYFFMCSGFGTYIFFIAFGNICSIIRL